MPERKSLIKYIRTILALAFLSIGNFIVPKKKSEKPKLNTKTDVSVFKPVGQEKPVPFTDLSSYLEQLQQPDNKDSACISICHQLKNLSKKKKGPVRLNFLLTTNYDKEGVVTSSNNSSISGYSNSRWTKLKDLVIGPAAIITLVDEMISAMGQDGWGCMNDSAEQLVFYLSKCVTNNHLYATERCKRLGVEAVIRVRIGLIVDDDRNEQKKTVPSPQIHTNISVKIGKEDAVESAHYIYFCRRHEVTTKPPMRQ